MKNLTTSENIDVVNHTKGRLPSLPFVDLKNKILGKRYVLSISFVDEKTSKSLNQRHRRKNKPTNILSFPYSEKHGELILEPLLIKAECVKFDLDYKSFSVFLLIHGMLHLKGMEHSSIMEKYEKKFFKLFTNKTLTCYD